MGWEEDLEKKQQTNKNRRSVLRRKKSKENMKIGNEENIAPVTYELAKTTNNKNNEHHATKYHEVTCFCTACSLTI